MFVNKYERNSTGLYTGVMSLAENFITITYFRNKWAIITK